MPNKIGTIHETKRFCRYRVRNPKRFKTLRTITLSNRKGIKAIVGSQGKSAYSRKSKIQAILFDKAFYNCSKVLPIARRIARKPKVM